MDEEFVKLEKVSNYSKWRGKRRPKGYDRPGRADKAEKRYRRGKTHTGKTTTLRDHRGGKTDRAKAIEKMEKRQAEAEALASRPKRYSFSDLYLALTPNEQKRLVQNYFPWADSPYFGPYGDSK